MSKLLDICLLSPDQTESIESLLREGESEAARDALGRTALHLCATACWSREVENTVQLLLRYGADIEARADRGEESVSLLDMPGTGWTPLIYAVWEGSAGSVLCFLKAGANVNARDTKGYTPLMLTCAQTKDLRMKIKYLLHHGANPRTVAQDSRTAMMILLKHRKYCMRRLADPSLPAQDRELRNKFRTGFIKILKETGFEPKADTVPDITISGSISEHINHKIRTIDEAIGTLRKALSASQKHSMPMQQ
ncbi:MAG: ankyrin repeat domain-containing protein [Candidatus Sumerlaeota bacterium]|nr:ankyrin repeat domain-containing protein [Candidatus Sumerlaeota bacterium]